MLTYFVTEDYKINSVFEYFCGKVYYIGLVNIPHDRLLAWTASVVMKGLIVRLSLVHICRQVTWCLRN